MRLLIGENIVKIIKYKLKVLTDYLAVQASIRQWPIDMEIYLRLKAGQSGRLEVNMMGGRQLVLG